MAAIVPFAERRRRLPQAGRIRSGVKAEAKNGKIRPSALDTFRFTAPRRDDLDVIAALYGGTVRPWSEPKSEDRFEALTDASEIEVALAPDPLGDGPTYERWGGNGWERRCDGVTATVPRDGPDGREEVGVPCICRQQNRRGCKPKLRLHVLLPTVSMRGTWRFDTGSDLAADEMPGMVELIQSLQPSGLARAALRLDRQQSQGGANRFVVPRLGILTSVEGVMAGAARLGAGDTPRAALGPSRAESWPAEIEPAEEGEQGPPIPPASPDDDDVVDAEIVGEPSSELDAMLAMLNPDEAAQLKDWWRRSELPKREHLTPQQEIQVAAQIKRVVTT